MTWSVDPARRCGAISRGSIGCAHRWQTQPSRSQIERHRPAGDFRQPGRRRRNALASLRRSRSRTERGSVPCLNNPCRDKSSQPHARPQVCCSLRDGLNSIPHTTHAIAANLGLSHNVHFVAIASFARPHEQRSRGTQAMYLQRLEQYVLCLPLPVALIGTADPQRGQLRFIR